MGKNPRLRKREFNVDMKMVNKIACSVAAVSVLSMIGFGYFSSQSYTNKSSEFDTDDLSKWVRSHYAQLPKEVSAPLFRAVQNMRHLSKQEARKYAKRKLKPGGVYYEVHRSSLFYSEPSQWQVV